MALSSLLDEFLGQDQYRQCEAQWTAYRLTHDWRTIQRCALAIFRQLCAVRAAYERPYQDMDTADLLDCNHYSLGHRDDHDG